MKPPRLRLSSPAISSSCRSKLVAGMSEVQRAIGIIAGNNFLVVAAGVATGAVFWAESVAGAGVEDVADLGVVGAGVAGAIGGAGYSKTHSSMWRSWQPG